MLDPCYHRHEYRPVRNACRVGVHVNAGKCASSHRVLILLAALTGFLLPLHQMFATSWGPLSDAALCDTADRIVIGQVKEGKKDGELQINVSETLKGEHQGELPLGLGRLLGDQLFRPGSTGVFFLRRDDKRFTGFHPACFQPSDRAARIREVLLMYSDPTRFAARPDSPLDPDFAYVLGRLFGGFAITSREIPTIGDHMKNFAEPYYVEAPWNQKQTVRVTCRHNPKNDPPITIIAAEPEGKLSAFLADRMKIASKWDYVRATLVPEFTVQLDAVNPPRVGNLTYPQAIAYLHRCLNASNAVIVETALTSLSEIRDTTAIAPVVALLSHEDKQVRVHAIKFLGYMKDERTIQPIAELLRRVSPTYPENHEIANAACDALALVGAQGAIPALEFAARHGVETAGYALGRIGTTETFQTLLDCYLKHPTPPDSFTAGLLWLVMRSNQTTEKWMNDPVYSSAIGIQKKPLWDEWWKKNRHGFKVVHSMTEAVEIQRKR